MKPTLVIGDVHGHHDRLTALLEQEGIVQGGERVNLDVEVIQLGDLGHFGQTQTPANDRACWAAAADHWIDLVLWGNHDLAVFDRTHRFLGYESPPANTFALMYELKAKERVVFAAARHGYLLTHAGMHSEVAERHFVGSCAQTVAESLNARKPREAIDSIPPARGGSAEWGGILWRDDRSEPLAPQWLQVYGHTRGEVRQHGQSYCVDVSSEDNGRLAAVWLPECRVVEVALEMEVAA